jgi:D-glycero-D-manno-heptose 1,7-bisphosphate phosphatase
MVGDSAGDLGAGAAAGCRTILVRTGYGASVEATVAAGELAPPTAIVDALPDAVTYILSLEQASR